MRKLYIYELADKLRRTNGGGRTFLVLLFMLLVGSMEAWATSTKYYAKLTATSSATGKGLVYTTTSNTTVPTASQYQQTASCQQSNTTQNTVWSFYAWAKAARGYKFSGWDVSGDASTVVKSSPQTGNPDEVTVTAASTSSEKPTTGTVTATWSDATPFILTFGQPKYGEYSVAYSYYTVQSNKLTQTTGDAFTMTASSENKTVKTYEGDTVTLSTTATNFEGWYEDGKNLSTDATFTYSPSKAATITARFTQPPQEYKVSVNDNGSVTQYKTIQEAIAAANRLTTNPTVTLLDNITLNDTIINITKSMTIDLNDFKLQGTGGRRSPSSKSDLSRTLLNVNGSGIAVTITDNSTAKTGTISCTDSLNHTLYTIFLNNGTLNLDGGTIRCENTAIYSNNTSERAYTVYVQGNKAIVLNLRGANVEAKADRYAYGINATGWKDGQNTVNISGGTVTAEGTHEIRGVNTNSNLYITDGTVEGISTGSTQWSSTSYGVFLNASTNANSDYHATMTMSGGTVKATSQNANVAYGIRVNRGVYCTTGTNTVEKIVQAEATITGGSIIAETKTDNARGIDAYGPVTISGGAITASTGTSSAYGIRACYGKTIVSGTVTIAATATNSAYGVVAAAENNGQTGVPAEGEVQVDGGTINATTTTGANAYGILLQSNAIQITKTDAGYYPGYYAAAGKTSINGGAISATAKTTGGYAVYVTGITTKGTASATSTCSIIGGKFKASGTNAACVNSTATNNDFTIAGGYYQSNVNLSTYVPDDMIIYSIATTTDEYSEGYRFYISQWDDSKEAILNKTTKKTYTSLKTALGEARSGETVVVTENYRFDDAADVNDGVTLLVPYDENYGSSTTVPGNVINHQTISGQPSTWQDVSAYKTLYMLPDASLTVKSGGAICVAGQQYATSNRMGATGAGGPGSPIGSLGCINMSKGGKIILEDGSALYAWGFIMGQDMNEGNNTSGVGTIEAQSGSKVYEMFVIGDWHGGSATSGNLGNKKFPFNQYFFPNIEVPLTIEHGATETTVSNISAGYGTNKNPYSVEVPLIGPSETLFIMGEGSTITKWYDATTDDEHLDFSGDVSISSITVDLGGTKVDSKSYIMPLTSNLNVRVKSGGKMILPYEVTLLPGSKIVLEDNATADVQKNIYVYDMDDWDRYAYSYYRHCFPYRLTEHKKYNWTDAAKDTDASSVKIEKMTNMGLTDAKLEIDGNLTVSGNIYTTTTGGNICSTGYGQIKLAQSAPADTKLYQVLDLSTEKAVSVTAAQLHNADNSYVKTAGASAGTTYYYDPNTGTWSDKKPEVNFSYNTADSRQLKLEDEKMVTKGLLKEAITDKSATGLLSADLTNATNKFDVAAMRTAIIGKATDGDNVLLYVNTNTEGTDGTKNVVVKGSDETYTAANFVITDKKPVSVPTAFTAAAASYSRTGSNQWGTICLPFALASGNGIQYYELESVKNDKMTFKAVETVNANTPAVYSLSSGSGISIDDDNVSVPVTSSPTVNMGGCTLVGVQTEMVTLADGSSNYYIAENKFWQPTGTSVNIRPQRAYFKINSASGAKVFSIGVDDTVTAIDSISGNDGTTIVGIYSLNGMRQGSLQKGVNIVKFSDGTTRKVVIK